MAVDLKKLDKNPIALGILAILVGGAITWFYILKKLDSLSTLPAGSKVYYSMKIPALAPVFIIIGLFYLLFRPDGLTPGEMKPRTRIMYWIFVVLAISSGIATGLWFEHQIKAMGYVDE